MINIRYYGIGDQTSYMYFSESVDFIKNYKKDSIEKDNINFLLLVYNVFRNVDDKKLRNAYSTLYCEDVGKIYSNILKPDYFRILSKITSEEVVTFRMNLEEGEADVFWNWVNDHIVKIIKDKDFKHILDSNPYDLIFILYNKKVVSKFSSIIKNFFLSNGHCGQYILDYYADSEKEMFLPNLNTQEVNHIMETYIDFITYETGYLKMIMEFGNRQLHNNNIFLSGKVKKKAKNKYNQIQDKIYNDNGDFLMYGLRVEFTENLGAKYREFQRIDNEYIIKYNLSEILSDKSEIVLLMNCIYYFELLDYHCRIAVVNKNTEDSLVDIITGPKVKGNYKINTCFITKNQIVSMAFQGYCHILIKNSKPIEKLIEWYYNSYLRDAFGIKDFHLSIPDYDSLPYESKILTLFPKLDSIINQYQLYVENGSIDTDLLELDSHPIEFSSAKSLLSKKYITLIPKKIDGLLHILFSDQNTISYFPKAKTKGNRCFYDIMLTEKVLETDIAQNDITSINLLKEFDIIFIDKDGQVKLQNNYKAKVLKDLYENRVLSYWHYGEREREYIDTLVEKGYCLTENGLLSSVEIDFLNYILNNKSFYNSISLRNKYMHGKTCGLEDNEHERNYYTALMVLVIITLKINDDLCLYWDYERGC